ncbi:hypothetical protein ACW95P_02720 [Candidatus Mycoplasma pogonae]
MKNKLKCKDLKKEILNVIPEITDLTILTPLEKTDILIKKHYISLDFNDLFEDEDGITIYVKEIYFNLNLYSLLYSIRIDQNKFDKEDINRVTDDVKKAILLSVRKKIYENLFIHVNDTINDLNINSNASAIEYKGGFTKEAELKCLDLFKFDFYDLDSLISSVINLKNNEKKDFFILMHVETLQYLQTKIMFKNNLSIFEKLYDLKNNEYNGVKILTSFEYPFKFDSFNKLWKKDDIPAAICHKKSFMIYGLEFEILDNKKYDKENDTYCKYVKTRGEVKMIDPFVNSKFLKIRDI